MALPILMSWVVTNPSIGVACALGLQWQIEHKDTMDDVYIYLFGGSGYDP